LRGHPRRIAAAAMTADPANPIAIQIHSATPNVRKFP
jgi:hypothetical protein